MAFNLNLVVLYESSLSLSAAHFFILCTTDKRKLHFFRSLELDIGIDCSVNSRKLQKNIFNSIFSAHIINLSSNNFAVSTQTAKPQL